MTPRPTVLLLAAVAALATAVAGCSSARTAGRPGSSSSVAHASSAPGRPAVSHQPAALAKRIHRSPNPCRHNRAPKFVRVSLRRQHLWMCARGHLVRETAITSGMAGQYTATPTGRYRIQGRNRNTTLTLNTGQQYAVKYWIPFDAPLFGFHDASWQTFPFGSPKYRAQGSHGCVHVPLRAIAFLYRWADFGTPVRIAA